VTGSDLEVTSFDRKSWKWLWKDKNAYIVHFTFYKAVAQCRRESRDRK